MNIMLDSLELFGQWILGGVIVGVDVRLYRFGVVKGFFFIFTKIFYGLVGDGDKLYLNKVSFG